MVISQSSRFTLTISAEQWKLVLTPASLALDRTTVLVNADSDGLYTAVLFGFEGLKDGPPPPPAGVLFMLPYPTVRGAAADIPAAMVGAIEYGLHAELTKVPITQRLAFAIKMPSRIGFIVSAGLGRAGDP